MKTNGNKVMDVKCEKCRKVIYRRKGDTLVAFGFELDLKRSQNVVCTCGEVSRFCVNRDKITVDFKHHIV